MLSDKTLVLGCGNILRGDDGFGPAVVNYIEKNLRTPDSVEILDAGLSASMILLDLILADNKPKKIILIDCLQKGGRPGELHTFKSADLPITQKTSLHGFPDREMLDKLEKTGVSTVFLCCEPGYLPSEVSTVMSAEVTSSIPKAAELTLKLARDP